jgi:hypothetical protein
MGGGLDLEGERGQQREADDHAGAHDGQRARLLARRARRASGQQVGGRQRRGDRRPPEGDEPRVEVGHGKASGRQREREADDPEAAEQEARR